MILSKHIKDYPDIRKYISKNCNYPDYAIEKRITGKVFFQFHINISGCLDSLLFINKPDTTLSNEIKRVLMTTDCKWTPAKVTGTSIDSWYYTDFLFQMIE